MASPDAVAVVVCTNRNSSIISILFPYTAFVGPNNQFNPDTHNHSPYIRRIVYADITHTVICLIYPFVCTSRIVGSGLLDESLPPFALEQSSSITVKRYADIHRHARWFYQTIQESSDIKKTHQSVE